MPYSRPCTPLILTPNEGRGICRTVGGNCYAACLSSIKLILLCTSLADVPFQEPPGHALAAVLGPPPPGMQMLVQVNDVFGGRFFHGFLDLVTVSRIFLEARIPTTVLSVGICRGPTKVDCTRRALKLEDSNSRKKVHARVLVHLYLVCSSLFLLIPYII